MTVQRPTGFAVLTCAAALLLTACGTGDDRDTERPSVPSRVTAQTSSATSAHVMWERSADNKAVTGYEIYQKGTKVKEVAGDRSMIDVDRLKPSTAYSFTVRARDAAGNLSAASPAIPVTTPAPTPEDRRPPSRPVKLRGKADGGRAADLSWRGSTDDVGVTAYDIYQEDARIHSVRGTQTTAHLTGLRPGTVYTFTVRARDASDTSSGFSNSLDVTTTSAPGAPSSTAPTGLRARPGTASGERTIELSWTPPKTGGAVESYQLYLDGRMTTTIVWGADAPKDKATYRLTLGDGQRGRISVKLRARLPDGKWGDFSAQRTVVTGGS